MSDGSGPQVSAITERGMNGEVDFADALRTRVEMLAGLPVSVLDELVRDLELMPGALAAVRTLQARGVLVGVVSGGFATVVAPLARALRMDFWAANKLDVVDDVLTGRVVGDILDGKGKAKALREFAARQRIPLGATVAVGDGANDIDMIRSAGLGIAFTGRTEVVSAADVAISFPRLDLVLPALGVPVPCGVVQP